MDKRKPLAFYNASGKSCRSGGIRTRGLLVPNQTRYQTALHLEKRANRGTRTLDLRFTKPLLYRLSHVGTAERFSFISIANMKRFVKRVLQKNLRDFADFAGKMQNRGLRTQKSASAAPFRKVSRCECVITSISSPHQTPSPRRPRPSGNRSSHGRTQAARSAAWKSGRRRPERAR